MKHRIIIILGTVSMFFLTSCDQIDELKQSTDDLIQQTMDKADEVIKESKEKVKTATDSILGNGSDTSPTDAETSKEPAEKPEADAPADPQTDKTSEDSDLE